MDTTLPSVQENPENKLPQKDDTKEQAEELWRRCLDILSKEVTANDYRIWLEPIRAERIEDGVNLILFLPHKDVYEYIEDHLVDPLRAALNQVFGVDTKIGYVFEAEIAQNSEEDIKKIINEQQKEQQLIIKRFDELYEKSQINPNYVFENFIEGSCNRLARSAGWAVAQQPGTNSKNPLVLYGGVGLGKTHLMQAVGNYIMENDSAKRVVYVSVDKFTAQFVYFMKNNDLETFKKYYQQVDLLLLDDIQFLAGKESTQEIFFHIFNHLQQSGRQIIMTSDCSPVNLKGMADRLLSRFKWGILADLQQPDLETRMAIIQKKLQEKDVVFPDDVIEYLTQNVDSNVREMEGAINSLIHYSLNGVTPSLSIAQQVIRNIVQSNTPRETTIDDVFKAVAEHFSTTVEELKGKSRKKEIVHARQLAMYIAKEHTRASLKIIGATLGGRDHSTVIHSIQAITDLVNAKNKDIKTDIDNIKRKF